MKGRVQELRVWAFSAIIKSKGFNLPKVPVTLPTDPCRVLPTQLEGDTHWLCYKPPDLISK